MLTPLLLNYFRKIKKCWLYWLLELTPSMTTLILNVSRRIKNIDYIDSWWWLHWLWLMTTLLVIVQPTATSISNFGPDLASRDHEILLLTHWQPTFAHLWPSGVALSPFISNWSYLEAWTGFIRFWSVFLHFPLILMKSTVTTSIMGDDYFDNVTWCHPSVTMTTQTHPRSVGHITRPFQPYRPSTPMKILRICFEILKKNGWNVVKY
jgi:hypothetical protein